jgi:hypothetical protein
MPGKRGQQPAIATIPHPRRLVSTRRHDALAVGREDGGIDRTSVSRQRGQQMTVSGPPDAGRTVLARRDNALAVGRESAAEWGKSWLFGSGKGSARRVRVFGLGTDAKRSPVEANGGMLGCSREAKWKSQLIPLHNDF